MLKQLPVLCSLFIAVLAMTACTENKIDERRTRYMPDMASSPAWESQEAFLYTERDASGNVVSRHEVPVMMTPVPGTVSRDFVTYDVPAEDIEASKSLVNPLSATAEVYRRGKDRYDIFCAVCHGLDGNKDNGYVAGKVNGIISINTDSVTGKPDGELYHIITHGRGRMPNYKAQLLPEDRWAVIHYVRTLKVETAAAEIQPAVQEEVVGQ